MRYFLSLFTRLWVLVGLIFAPLPAFAGVVSQFSDTVSVHTTSANANHTITFVTPTGVDAPSDTILLTFASGFSLASLSAPLDFDFAVGSSGTCSTAVFTDKTLAGASGAGTWGVGVSGQAVTFTAPTDAVAGEIPAGRCVQVEIGTQATNGGAGTQRITNPGTSGTQIVWLSGTFGDRGETGVAITSPGQLSVGATVSTGNTGGGGAVIIASPPPDVVAPVISNIQVPVLGIHSAEISWNTDELANSTVEYGLTPAYELGSVVNGNLVFMRQLPLGGLSQGTTYHYRVISADGVGNTAVSDDRTFTTLVGDDTEAPIISGVQVTNITGTSASIGWSTNEAANSEVRYGLTPAYGLFADQGTMVTTHYLDITGLEPDTEYFYRVYSADAEGNIGQSSGFSFRTLDTVLPVIEPLTVNALTETSATVDFSTSETVTGSLRYGLSDTYGQDMSPAQGDSFSFALTGLAPNTQYFFEVRALDAGGNVSIRAGSFTTLPDTTPPSAVTGLSVVAGDRRNSLSWTNPSAQDFSQVRILRKTSGYPMHAADGVLVYTGSGTSFLNTGLVNGIEYFYGVFAVDATGNVGTGSLGSGTPFGEVVEPPVDVVLPVCGNGVCEMTENQQVCPTDCSIGQVTPRDLNTFTATDIGVVVRNRGVQIVPTREGVFDVLRGSEVLIEIGDAYIAGPVTSGVVTIGQERYTMFRGGSYDAFVQLPDAVLSLPANVTLTYEDGNFDSADFTLRLVDYGLVYSATEQGSAPVSGALVTLYRYAPNEQAYQTTTSDAQGRFVFVVTPGEYSVRVEKDGYAVHVVPRQYVQAVVNPVVQLFAITPITDILQSDQPIADTVLDLLSEASIRMQILRADPLVQEQASVIAPLATSVALANALAVTTVAVIANAGAWFQYLFLQPLLWFTRRKRKSWGIVYDSLTKLPVDLAVVRLLDAATGRVLQSRVTDREGRYFFLVDQGRYRLQVTKPGFVFPSAYLATKHEDVQYTELYHAEELIVTEQGATLAANIPLDPMDRVMIPAKSVLLKAAWRKFQVALSFGSVIAGAVAAYLHPTKMTLGLLGLQFVLLIVFRMIAVGKKPKGWGIVYDGATKQPLPNAVVRIFEPMYNKLLDTAVTDARGRYAFIVGPNTYYTTYERAGYTPYRLDGLDYRDAGQSAVIDKKVALMRTTPGAVSVPNDGITKPE